MTAVAHATQQPVQRLIPAIIGALLNGGVYAGIIRGVDGAPDEHLVLLLESTSGNWDHCMKFAKDHGGYLPTRREQALLSANLPEHFEREYYWSCEQRAVISAYAWLQYFLEGYQDCYRKSNVGHARPVRRFPI